MHQNIPAELRQLPQWVVSGPDKIPLNPRTGKAASVTDPATWATFEEASKSSYKNIGFVLTEQDPYTIIDLDNKPEHPLEESQLVVHNLILQNFDSYTEFSTSGRGYHIIVRGRVPAGVHSKDGVEIYSTGRYMICTGNIYGPMRPIQPFQELLDKLYASMKQEQAKVELDEDRVAIQTDEEVVEMAMHAENKDKFNDLCAGNWEKMGYPSQSEADYALLAILAFYTQDNEQVRRLFRYSALGQREKSVKNDVYLNRCLAKIRAVQAPLQVDISGLLSQAATATASLASQTTDPTPPSVPPPPVTAPTAPTSKPETVDQFSLPPGLVGELATYFYQTAVRPVQEVALCASIAALAGVAGRCYNISNTGLNQYLLVLAPTGRGKEAAASGIGRLWNAVRSQIPSIDDFMGPGTFASGQALLKVLNEKPCFVSILGEFGITLHQLCDPSANGAEKMLKKVLLDIYSKSGWTDYLGAMTYSNKDNNTKAVQAPNVTILGESNPDTFFSNLDISHIAEGLIPRFSIVEVTSKRPPINENAGILPPKRLVDHFSDVAVKALSAQQNNSGFQAVAINPKANSILMSLNDEADGIINASDSSNVELELWNRAHLKALKLSGLLAVGCNPHTPVVDELMATWAVNFVKKDVLTVTKRYAKGDIGHGDSKRLFDLRRVIEFYLKSEYPKIKNYDVEEQYHKDKVIPYVYLQRKTANLAAFKNDRRGSSLALQTALQTLVDGGFLVLLPPATVTQRYKTSAKLYVLVKAWQDGSTQV